MSVENRTCSQIIVIGATFIALIIQLFRFVSPYWQIIDGYDVGIWYKCTQNGHMCQVGLHGWVGLSESPWVIIRLVLEGAACVFFLITLVASSSCSRSCCGKVAGYRVAGFFAGFSALLVLASMSTFWWYTRGSRYHVAVWLAIPEIVLGFIAASGMCSLSKVYVIRPQRL